MTRQSISLSKPNDEWLKSLLSNEEYASKSEVINDLIRKARENEFIKAKIEEAEKSGFTNLNKDQILSLAKSKAGLNV
jgi:antitoxin ParD1/3/4